MASFFSSDHRPHRVCTTFCTDFTRFTVNPAVTGLSPCFSQKLFRAFANADETDWRVPFHFFRHCVTFSIFFCIQRVPPSSFFDNLQQRKVPKSPKGVTFYVFRHYETVQNSHFSFFFRKFRKKNRIFLVYKASPFNFFDILQLTGFSKSSKSPPFTGLKFLRFLSLRRSADFRRVPVLFSGIVGSIYPINLTVSDYVTNYITVTQLIVLWLADSDNRACDRHGVECDEFQPDSSAEGRAAVQVVHHDVQRPAQRHLLHREQEQTVGRVPEDQPQHRCQGIQDTASQLLHRLHTEQTNPHLLFYPSATFSWVVTRVFTPLISDLLEILSAIQISGI